LPFVAALLGDPRSNIRVCVIAVAPAARFVDVAVPVMVLVIGDATAVIVLSVAADFIGSLGIRLFAVAVWVGMGRVDARVGIVAIVPSACGTYKAVVIIVVIAITRDCHVDGPSFPLQTTYPLSFI
jgi:hypothetical protein